MLLLLTVFLHENLGLEIMLCKFFTYFWFNLIFGGKIIKVFQYDILFIFLSVVLFHVLLLFFE